MKKTILLLAVIALSAISLICLAKREPVNFCGQTMAEANDPINWHNGVYSPEGCDMSQYRITPSK